MNSLLAASASASTDAAEHGGIVLGPMHWVFIAVGCTLFLLMLFPMYRVLRGPTAIDRIVAVNMIGTKTAVLLVIIGIIYNRVDMFVDFALAYALLNFIGSIAASRYFFHTRPHDGGTERRMEAELDSDTSPV